jgi:hypothetical protein
VFAERLNDPVAVIRSVVDTYAFGRIEAVP